MSRTIQAVRAVGLAGLAALAFTASPMLAPASLAQETEEGRRLWRGLLRADGDEWLTRPMLGVMIAGERDGGVLVGQVLAGSPAEEAGIVEGDLIVSVDGHDLSEPLEAEDELDFDPDRSLPEERLRALVRELPDGESVTVVVERDGERLTLGLTPEILPVFGGWVPPTATLRELTDWWSDESARQEAIERIRELAESFRELPTFEWDTVAWTSPRTMRFFADTLPSGAWALGWDGGRAGLRGSHGLDLVDLNPGLGAYFGTAEGVLVADADDDTSLGLRPGDVVVAVDGRVVDDIDELRRILGSYRNDEEIAFRIFRDGAQTTVTGTIN